LENYVSYDQVSIYLIRMLCLYCVDLERTISPMAQNSTMKHETCLTSRVLPSELLNQDEYFK